MLTSPVLSAAPVHHSSINRCGGRLVWLLVAGWSTQAAFAAPPMKPGRHGEFPSETIRVGQEDRSYRLVAPKSVNLVKPAPLVIAFHGMGIDSKDLMPVYTRLNATAEAHGFLLAYPAAQGQTWGLLPKKIEADLAFFDALVSRIERDYRVDPRRIYLVGMSNGGYFAHLVGKERSKKIAAVMSHSGPLGLQTLAGIRAERKFPVLIVHGNDDPLFPIAIARENRDKYAREGHAVQLIVVPQLGHFWGTAANVNDSMWEFFRKHPLPEAGL